MALAYSAAGTAVAVSTRTLDITLPTLSGGEMVVIPLMQKYADRTIPTPSGWTLWEQATGGAGTNGTVDEGNVRIAALTKEVSAGDSGAVVSMTDSGGTASCFAGRPFVFTKGAGETWQLGSAAGVASDNTAGTACVFVYDIDPGFVAGDIAVTLWALNSDAYTHTHAISIPGVSSVTTQSRGNTAVTAGANGRYGMVTHDIVTGTSSGAATYTNTASGSATNAPAGASLILRLRVAAAGSGPSLAARVQRNLRAAWCRLTQAQDVVRGVQASQRYGAAASYANQAFAPQGGGGGLSGVAQARRHSVSQLRAARRRR